MTAFPADKPNLESQGLSLESKGSALESYPDSSPNSSDSGGNSSETAPNSSQNCPHSGPDRADQEPDKGDSRGFSDGDLDKLEKPNQNGGDKGDEARRTLRKRARAKYATLGVVKRLISLNSPMQDQYERALGCCKMIEQNDGRLTSRYCGDRWCVVCNRIRMGRRINAYRQVFDAWADQGDQVYMTTLTVPNVRASELGPMLDEMRDKLKLCRRAIRRTRGLRYQAVRSTECTFNAEREDFHPHFHLAVRGKEAAEAVVEEWLKRFDQADQAAQDVREWDGTDGGLKELTKYCTKLIGATKDDDPPPAWALDVIFRALKGRHLFRPVGFDLEDYAPDLDPDKVDDFEDDLDATVQAYSRPQETVNWWWDTDLNDWVDPATGECLTGYEPSEADRRAHREGRSPP